MARKGRLDRGLREEKDRSGKRVWKVRLYHDGREQEFGSFRTKTDARAFYDQAKHEQKMGRFFPERHQQGGYPLVDDVIDRHLVNSTVKNQWAEKNYAAWWKRRLHGTRVNTITPTVLEDALRDLAANQLANQTILHYMKFLRHVLNLAVRDGTMDRNPFGRITLPKPGRGRLRFLSPEEESALLHALGSMAGPWARLAILTGMRQGEQFSLRWRDVDLERGLLTLPDTKAGTLQYVPLNEEAMALLRAMHAVAEAEAIAEPRWRSPWVFPSVNRVTPLDPRNFYVRTYLPAVAKANLHGVTWHTLRHTFASRLAMNGATENTIAALLRHASTGLVTRYAHLSPSHLKAAMEGVASFGKVTPSGMPMGTRTQTGTGGKRETREGTELVENIGAGEGI